MRVRLHPLIAIVLFTCGAAEPTIPAKTLKLLADWQPRLKKDPWSKLFTTTQSISNAAQSLK